MLKSSNSTTVSSYLTIALLLFGVVACSESERASERQRPPAPVKVASIEAGTIRGQRTFSGALEASEDFTVSPKVGGRIDEILYDLGDSVPRNAIVARLDDAEFQQDVARAEADRMVARANFVESESSLLLTQRSIVRSESSRSTRSLRYFS